MSTLSGEASTEITVRRCQQESCISGTVGEGCRSLQERSSVVPGLRWPAAPSERKHAAYGPLGGSNWRLVTELSSCCSTRRKGTPIQVLMGSMTAPPRAAMTHMKHQCCRLYGMISYLYWAVTALFGFCKPELWLDSFISFSIHLLFFYSIKRW